MKILKIAVTGSAGSGKSLVCRRLGELGLVILDCDIIARQVVEQGAPGFRQVVELFGEKVVKDDGTLDRSRLRNIIVNDETLRKQLENALHPLIQQEMVRRMETAAYEKVPAVAVEVPLLFESGMEKIFDVTLAVTAAESDLLDRISQRDRVTKSDAQKMVNLQMSQADKINRADHVILNAGTQAELFESVDNLFARIQKEFLTT